MRQLHSREEYLRLLRSIIREHEERVRGDPFAVANSMVANAEFVGDDEPLTRTFGTSEIDDRALYPLDVIAYSEQPVGTVNERWNLTEPGYDCCLYAACMMASDLEDTVDD